MKNLFLILAFSILAACGQKPNSEEDIISEEPSNVLEKMTYTLDTLMIDSGEELFDLGNLPKFIKRNYFSVSQNSDWLYYFDRKRLILQEVDLNSLTLKNNYPFDQEGPNGVGSLVYTFKMLPNGIFLARDLEGHASFFSKTGKKLTTIELYGDELLQNTGLAADAISVDLKVDLKWKKLYSLPRNFTTSKIYFAVIDSMGKTGKILEIPEFYKIFDFNIEYSGDGGDLKVEGLHLQQQNDLVLISSTVGNAIYVYDPKLDSLFFKEFPHELTPLGKDIEVKNEVFSRKEFQAEADKLHTQIDYWDFYWDEQTQRYYRFASKGLPLANIDSPKKYEYYMFAYDKDLTLKGEIKLEGLSELPLGGFFKDGKLWSYVNVEDELGFAVFTFDF
jgi:hypothetical protein